MRKLSIVPLLLGTLFVVGVAFTTSTSASTAVFVKYDGVDGEASDMDHEGWIDLTSFSAPVHEHGTSTGATRRRGDVILEDLTFVKGVDKASPKLSEAVCNGKVFPKVEIHVTAAFTDSGIATYYAYELKNVRVTSYSVRAAGSSGVDAVPQEEMSLNFEEIKVTYTKADAKGKSKGNAETTWKVEKGEK